MTTSDLESRQVTVPIQMRTTDDNAEPIIEGYALKYDKPSEILGGFVRFIEHIAPGALDNTDMSNVVATINHDQNQVLGRSGVNLTLVPDKVGLKFSVKPTDTSFARDLITNIKAGVINQCSFAFTVPADDDAQEWVDSERDGVDYERTICKIDHLYDVSVVTTPAYPDTEATVGQRSIDLVKRQKESQNKEAVQQQRKKMLHDFERKELLDSLEGGN
ncbi:HK97 family phage prohead protease [uncultured Lactobacillus sp.]|jgi:HK97 family phage prohead protease|uniref:HK97 family phage prohead protease n=1 Tax=uncultured Lactobacillus sp. TaxID=153152 RepID=UPI002805DFC2|nr:HK97 family phage prohead protease [uncultured Lactobacillus sp.]